MGDGGARSFGAGVHCLFYCGWGGIGNIIKRLHGHCLASM